MRLALFFSLFASTRAVLRIIPSFLRDAEIEEFRAQTSNTPDPHINRRISNYTYINVDLHRRIRQAMMHDDECPIGDNHDTVVPSEVTVSTIFATTPIHQDRYFNGEQVCDGTDADNDDAEEDTLLLITITHYSLLLLMLLLLLVTEAIGGT
jgi:hypothetical protein